MVRSEQTGCRKFIHRDCQRLGCSVFNCEWHLDGECYCEGVRIGREEDSAFPVCLSYIGESLRGEESY